MRHMGRDFKDKLVKYRGEIDKIDDEILRLIEKRIEIAKVIGKIKREKGMSVVSFSRMKEVINRMKRKARVADKKAVEAIFTEIMSACIRAEGGVKVGFLGPVGTFSEDAGHEIFGNSVEYKPYESIDDVFEAVVRAEIDYGVVPIENSVEGSVNSTLDKLMEHEVYVVAEKTIPIRHNLVAMKGVKKEDIKVIITHPHALAQCRNYLRGMRCRLRSVSSTAEACRQLDMTSAAIASERAAKIYGLDILERDVQDSEFNSTRFIVIGRDKAMGRRTGKDKTSVIFSLKDEPGALYCALGEFAKRGINLTKIESRPSKKEKWEYVFFVDFEGHIEDRKCRDALTALGKRTCFLRVLGSYPREG
ncbi:MAG: prephenate dehydratase [Candidatus Micrarchaeia archaeon]